MSDHRTLKFWDIESDHTGSNIRYYDRPADSYQQNYPFDEEYRSELKKRDEKIEELQEFIMQVLNQKELVEAERAELISETKELKKQVQELVNERNALLLENISLNEASALFAKETTGLNGSYQPKSGRRVVIREDMSDESSTRNSRKEETKFNYLKEQQVRSDREIAKAMQDQLQSGFQPPRQIVSDRNLRSSVRRDNEIGRMPNNINPDNMNYEQLLELGDKIGHVSKGLTVNRINSFPTEIFSENSKRPADQRKCMVCHSEYENGEVLKRLQCTHDFHSECIGKWLSTKKTCPICFHEEK